MVAELPACRYLPVQDAELPACHYLPLRRQNYLPVQYAELSACLGCGIICLSRMRNYLPVGDADYYLPRHYMPVWYAALPARL
jgi:hypothetical protein